MARDRDPKRISEISEALAGKLEAGDEFIVRVGRRDVDVRPWPEGRDVLERDHPEVYGGLLALSERISSAGNSWFLPIMAAAVAFCLAVHMGWIRFFHLDTAWFYALVLVGALFLFSRIYEVLERRAYEGGRRDLRNVVEAAGLTRLKLLALIEGERSLRTVAERIKRDATWPE